MSNKTLLGVAAGLVILGQLIAMALVVDGQVSKAHLRDAQYAAERVAFAYCIENSNGVARNNCMRQVQAVTDPSREIDASQGVQTVASTSGLRNAVIPAPLLPGLMPASFTAR
ncbi:MAG: hypothetical protein ACYCZL_06855 [Polaromonas sp.]